MYTLEDYLNYYGDASFLEIPFNRMDALIFSLMPYLPVTEMRDGIKINTLYQKVEDITLGEKSLAHYIRSLLQKMVSMRRYENLRFYQFKKLVDKDMQFGAVTIRFLTGTFVAYEGTNSALIGWKENFLLSCVYHTKTQTEALNYFKKTIKFADRNIYVGGHSKGGNLAMYIGMEAPKNLFKRIKRIYNFDGPGFRKKEYLSPNYQRLSEKLENIIPDGSLIGILMNNSNYHVIKTNGKGFEKHSPAEWHVFGQCFVSNKLFESSAKLHDSINERVERLKEENMVPVIDTFFDILDQNNIHSKSDIKTLKFIEIKKLFNDTKNLDEESKKLFFDMIKILFLNRKEKK